MVLTPSTMLELGTTAPDFILPAPDGAEYTLFRQHIENGLLVIFICNHCPYVIHIREKLVEKCKEYQKRGIEVVTINSNDYTNYRDDAPEKMAEVISRFNFSFPYLIDKDQQVAKSYRAACTPDFFLFDREKVLFYRGQFDSARPGKEEPITGEDLDRAVNSMLAGEAKIDDQRPSMGCNIKWKEGNEPDYF